MAITVSNVRIAHTVGGPTIISGRATFDSLYATGGETMDLSSYFLSTSSPNIVLSGDDGYVPVSDRGTAAANKVLLYVAPAGNSAAALSQAAVNTNAAAVICTFFAMGTPA